MRTLAESGVKDPEVYFWQGIAAPRGLPADVKANISAAAIAAMRHPVVQQRMNELGLEIVANTFAEFTAFQSKEFSRWMALINKRGIHAD